MDEKQRQQISRKLMQLDPESDEFKRLMLKIAEDSDHPNDVAIARILRRELREESGDSDGTCHLFY